MKKPKTYFSDIDDEFSHSKIWLLERMKEREITELKVNEAKRVIGSDFYFCKIYDTVGERCGDFNDCGKMCDDYEPRNGKSGCCKHRGFCYEPGKEFILNINGKLTEVK